MKIHRVAILIIIVLLAFFLRFYKVTQDPPSLNWDEVSIGYNAYSIYKTGRDEWGKLLPLHFRAYGEYKLPVQIYASIPAIAIFGLNEFGVRITPVIFGTLTVLLMYFLAKQLFKDRNIAMASALLLAISPWHIHLTRASFESSFSVFWVCLGVWFMLRGFKNSKWFIGSSAAFVIGIYTYNSARVFIPLFLFTNILLYKRQWFKNRQSILIHLKKLALPIIIFIVLLLPLIPFTLSGDVADRYKLVSIIEDPGLVLRINEARGLSTLPEPLARLIHNKVTYVSRTFISNYLAHFTPDYLFVSGAPHKQHHVQNIGQLYFIQAPFILLGILLLFKKRHQYKWLLISWLVLAFIPVAITRDSIPHALRTIIAAPVYQMITAYGIVLALYKIKKNWIRYVTILFIVATLGIQFVGYINNYYNVYPKLYSRDWQYGYSQVVSYIREHYNEYDQIVFSRTYGEPHMFTLFFLNWDPAKYYNNPNLVRYQANDWVWVTNFDKFYFPDLGDEGTRFADIVKKEPDKKMLFIGKPGDFPENLTRLAKVDFVNGKRAFEIVESK